MTIKEVEKETIEKTEYIDKELPTIKYIKQIMKSTCEGEFESLSISDVSSEKALDTFKKIRDELK